jgi:hypothetical protein
MPWRTVGIALLCSVPVLALVIVIELPVLLLVLGLVLVLLAIGVRSFLVRRDRGGRWPAQAAQDDPRAERVVGSFGSYAEAGAAASRLRSVGIRSVLVPTSDAYPYGPAMGHELRVLARDFARAQAVLAEAPHPRHRRRTDAR